MCFWVCLVPGLFDFGLPGCGRGVGGVVMGGWGEVCFGVVFGFAVFFELFF